VNSLRQIYGTKGLRKSQKYDHVDQVHREYGKEIKESVAPNDIEQRSVDLSLPVLIRLPSGQPI